MDWYERAQQIDAILFCAQFRQWPAFFNRLLASSFDWHRRLLSTFAVWLSIFITLNGISLNDANYKISPRPPTYRNEAIVGQRKNAVVFISNIFINGFNLCEWQILIHALQFAYLNPLNYSACYHQYNESSSLCCPFCHDCHRITAKIPLW